MPTIPRRNFKHTTIRGKVVYGRPTHFFGIMDVVRIMRKTRGSFSQYSLVQLIAFYAEVTDRIVETSNDLGDLLYSATSADAAAVFQELWNLFEAIVGIVSNRYTQAWNQFVSSLTVPASGSSEEE